MNGGGAEGSELSAGGIVGVAPSRPGLVARVCRAVGGLMAKLPRVLAVPLVAFWMYVIWYVSSITVPHVGTGNAASAVIGNLGHAPEFGLLALWVCLLLPRRNGWVDTEASTLRYVWLFVLVYAIVDEAHQGMTAHRDPSVFDVLTDTVAAAIVLMTVRYAGGAHADATKLGKTLAWGMLACLVCACLASFIPPLAPTWEWL